MGRLANYATRHFLIVCEYLAGRLANCATDTVTDMDMDMDTVTRHTHEYLSYGAAIVDAHVAAILQGSAPKRFEQ